MEDSLMDSGELITHNAPRSELDLVDLAVLACPFDHLRPARIVRHWLEELCVATEEADAGRRRHGLRAFGYFWIVGELVVEGC